VTNLGRKEQMGANADNIMQEGSFVNVYQYSTTWHSASTSEACMVLLGSRMDP
jgi:hypothetical protein